MINKESLQITPYQTLLDNIKNMVINPAENNRDQLFGDIDYLFSCIPPNEEPYINNLQGNYDFLKDFQHIDDNPRDKKQILQAVAQTFNGAIKFQHPHVLHNIIPTPLVAGVAAATLSNLYNLNAIWDKLSAGAQAMEIQVGEQLATMAGWVVPKEIKKNNPGGISTIGGKACILYAIKIGLNRCIKNASLTGLSQLPKAPLVITSKGNHLCIDSVCALLGIGSKNCWRCEVNEDETINLSSFESLLRQALTEGYPIACIILSGGNTSHLTPDDAVVIKECVSKLEQEYNLDYSPYIYFDSCISWPWLFFASYNFADNPLELPLSSLKLIQKATMRISSIKYADGFGVDFHKTGLSSYSSSFFVTKNMAELHGIVNPDFSLVERNKYGGNAYFNFTLEHSRSASSIFYAWVALQSLGINGFRAYLAHLTYVGLKFREGLKDSMEVVNDFSLAPGSLFFPKSPNTSLNYKALKKASENAIENANDYTYNLFNYLQDKKLNGKASFSFRYIPQYGKAENGKNIAVIVIYPMSLFFTEEILKVTLSKIKEIKIDFDSKEILEKTNDKPMYVMR
ncbi:Glutamate decarboxylase [Candidatus Hepatincolaceae symbiont of Richtersius coronifer]